MKIRHCACPTLARTEAGEVRGVKQSSGNSMRSINAGLLGHHVPSLSERFPAYRQARKLTVTS